MIKYTIHNLTTSEQELFVDMFYKKVNFNDYNSPNPWGCPWHWDHNSKLEEDTIENLVDAFYWENYKEIKQYE